MTRTFGPVRRDHHIPTRPAQLDQCAQRARAAARARPPHRLVAESRDNARDDFAVAMLADQHMGTRSSIPDRNHQLLSVPKGQNNMATFTIQPIDRRMPARLVPHRPRNRSNQGSCNRRQQRTFDPVLHSFLRGLPLFNALHSIPLPVRFTHPSRPEIARRAADGRPHRAAAILRATPFRQWCPDPTRRYDPHFESWTGGARSQASFDSSLN